jgi:hypothetical protein
MNFPDYPKLAQHEIWIPINDLLQTLNHTHL